MTHGAKKKYIFCKWLELIIIIFTKMFYVYIISPGTAVVNKGPRVWGVSY